jgi:hypothetical protein
MFVLQLAALDQQEIFNFSAQTATGSSPARTDLKRRAAVIFRRAPRPGQAVSFSVK